MKLVTKYKSRMLDSRSERLKRTIFIVTLSIFCTTDFMRRLHGSDTAEISQILTTENEASEKLESNDLF